MNGQILPVEWKEFLVFVFFSWLRMVIFLRKIVIDSAQKTTIIFLKKIKLIKIVNRELVLHVHGVTIHN